MNDPNLHLLEAAVRLLKPLLDELVFVGGCTTGLLITDAAASGIRATKLEAFRGRGNDDYRSSHDLEDVITVVDGRQEIVSEMRAAQSNVRRYVAAEMRRLLGTRQFLDALPGFLLPDSASQGRRPLLRERLNALAQSDAYF